MKYKSQYEIGWLRSIPPKDEPIYKKEANVHLIAAAPALLEALRTLERGIRLWISEGVSDADMEAARSAIAAAEGRSK